MNNQIPYIRVNHTQNYKIRQQSICTKLQIEYLILCVWLLSMVTILDYHGNKSYVLDYLVLPS